MDGFTIRLLLYVTFPRLFSESYYSSPRIDYDCELIRTTDYEIQFVNPNTCLVLFETRTEVRRGKQTRDLRATSIVLFALGLLKCKLIFTVKHRFHLFRFIL
jgi:hypothetical protein